jgi:hypothetical protein
MPKMLARRYDRAEPAWFCRVSGLVGYGGGMSAPAYRNDHDGTVIPLAHAPGLAELAQRARAHERITLTEAGAETVIIMSAVSPDDHQAILDWEAAFIAETMTGAGARGPYLPNDLAAALDDADPATAEASLSALEAHAGEDVPAAQQWTLWERLTCG